MKDIDKKDVADVAGGATEYPTSGWPGPDVHIPFPQEPISPYPIDDPWITDPNPDLERQQ